LSLLEASASMRPLKLGFGKPYLELVVFTKSTSGIADVGDPSEEIVFGATETSAGSSRVVLKEFNDVSGLAEAGGVTLGDYLVFVNGIPVGAGCRFYENGPRTNLDDVAQMCKDENLFPLALTFARPSQDSRWGSFKMETATTFCITANKIEELGCEFGQGKLPDDIVVTNLFAVKGPFRKMLGDSKEWLGMAVESIDGQIVPTYATPKMITSALQRSWKTNEKVEIMFCDDIQRDRLKTLVREKKRVTE